MGSVERRPHSAAACLALHSVTRSTPVRRISALGAAFRQLLHLAIEPWLFDHAFFHRPGVVNMRASARAQGGDRRRGGLRERGGRDAPTPPTPPMPGAAAHLRAVLGVAAVDWLEEQMPLVGGTSGERRLGPGDSRRGELARACVRLALGVRMFHKSRISANRENVKHETSDTRRCF